MTLKDNINWTQLIRQYVYELIILYITLIVISVAYVTWQKSTANEFRELANEYHLASNYHLIKTIEEIRHLENSIIYDWAIANKEAGLQSLLIESEGKHSNHAASIYLIQKEIQAAIKLQHRFANSKFVALSNRLVQHLTIFEKSSRNMKINSATPNHLINSMLGLKMPLRQLERLHTIERNKLLVKLNSHEKQQALTFFMLISIVILASFFITKKGLKAINKVITNQEQSAEQIRIYSNAIEQSPVSVMITDTDANLIFVNSAFEKVSGYSSADVIGKNPSLLQSGKTPESTYKEIWRALTNGKTWDCELYNRKKNGENYCEHAHFSPVLDESGVISHFLVIKEDITLRKEQEQQIIRQAHYDTLTNLPNRFLVLDRLSQLVNEAQRKNERVAVIFLDLDDFKKVNDTLGHETGDKLLIEAAVRLLSTVRSSDTVGRLGGDEFIILLAELANAEATLPVIENLLSQFRNAFKIDGRELILTASIGIAVFPGDGENPSDLLRNADSAMYYAKELGRNTYSYFTEAMNNKVSRRFALEQQMHGALERGEFYLLYQPKINISNGHISGAEALLRWDNPVLDQVFPDEFIPIAEQTGFIMAIGEFVLTEAMRLTRQWQQEYASDFCIAVNISPRQFHDPDLVAHIKNILLESCISAESLELEITEGVLMSGHAYIDEALNALADLGVNLAMDDFGTGYSSLSYLRNYPFDTLKIDRSFVNDIIVDTADKELVNATIAMAHGLGLKVVAEGVETKEQLAHLETQGCEYAQGYLFSKPVSSEKFARLLKDRV